MLELFLLEIAPEKPKTHVSSVIKFYKVRPNMVTEVNGVVMTHALADLYQNSVVAVPVPENWELFYQKGVARYRFR